MKKLNILLIADIGYASPYWLDYCRILQEDFDFNVKVISPKMNRWQKKFFNVQKVGSVELLETKSFPMFYRRVDGMPRLLRRIVKSGELLRNKLWGLTSIEIFRPAASNHEAWVPLAVKEILELMTTWKVDVLISTCLPFEVHEIAKSVKIQTSAAWIADYRDPYSHSHTRSGQADSGLIEHEKAILSTADACTTTSFGFSAAVRKVFGGPIHVLHNGFDELNKNPKPPIQLPIEILYQGSIYPNFQFVSIVLEALDGLYDNLQVEKSLEIPIRITFGGFSTHVVQQFYSMKGQDLPSWVKLQGIFDFGTTRLLQQSANFLLLLNWEDLTQPGVMQTKLYEYISSGTPILSTGGSYLDETSEILRSTNTAHHFRNSGELTRYLQDVLRKLEIDYAPNYQEILKFSRRNQAKVLAELIENLTQVAEREL